ncbi:inositol hexakisphosphate anddiphosphoinositol-pentakisphosphate kinase 1 [Striga asiatica]|uniref:Inositol hexakisphosphate anddiphosphoinositol-pentakisphosphate kinase 1 n=1 Tax=Striga asiatica TaxID=4170 RepID=A0A5A7QWE9_STRAF|nr:inositol hexakisphosphate anddiphosphoinositol-pentakisphosphate kinase 1 [Striga asiatica]
MSVATADSMAAKVENGNLRHGFSGRHGDVRSANESGSTCMYPVASMTPDAKALTRTNMSLSGCRAGTEWETIGRQTPAMLAARMEAMAMSLNFIAWAEFRQPEEEGPHFGDGEAVWGSAAAAAAAAAARRRRSTAARIGAGLILAIGLFFILGVGFWVVEILWLGFLDFFIERNWGGCSIHVGFEFEFVCAEMTVWSLAGSLMGLSKRREWEGCLGEFEVFNSTKVYEDEHYRLDVYAKKRFSQSSSSIHHSRGTSSSDSCPINHGHSREAASSDRRAARENQGSRTTATPSPSGDSEAKRRAVTDEPPPPGFSRKADINRCTHLGNFENPLQNVQESIRHQRDDVVAGGATVPSGVRDGGGEAEEFETMEEKTGNWRLWRHLVLLRRSRPLGGGGGRAALGVLPVAASNWDVPQGAAFGPVPPAALAEMAGLREIVKIALEKNKLKRLQPPWKAYS